MKKVIAVQRQPERWSAVCTEYDFEGDDCLDGWFCIERSHNSQVEYYSTLDIGGMRIENGYSGYQPCEIAEKVREDFWDYVKKRRMEVSDEELYNEALGILKDEMLRKVPEYDPLESTTEELRDAYYRCHEELESDGSAIPQDLVDSGKSYYESQYESIVEAVEYENGGKLRTDADFAAFALALEQVGLE